jgi:short-subunit dehydrogenase
VSRDQKIVIFGATSTMAVEIAKRYADRKARIFLVARSAEKLAPVEGDVRARGGEPFLRIADLNDFGTHQPCLDEAVAAMGGVDLVFVCHGTLSDQKGCERDVALMRRELDTNFTTAASILSLAANYLEAQKGGGLVVISSVAGDRGRQSNYVYGSAKAALNTFTQGLRNRLAPHNVRVLTVKPGFVSTAMTAHLKQNGLYAKPADVADAIVRAVDAERNVLYVPWFWAGIMGIIKAIPEPIFKRLKL